MNVLFPGQQLWTLCHERAASTRAPHTLAARRRAQKLSCGFGRSAPVQHRVFFRGFPAVPAHLRPTR